MSESNIKQHASQMKAVHILNLITILSSVENDMMKINKENSERPECTSKGTGMKVVRLLEIDRIDS